MMSSEIANVGNMPRGPVIATDRSICLKIFIFSAQKLTTTEHMPFFTIDIVVAYEVANRKNVIEDVDEPFSPIVSPSCSQKRKSNSEEHAELKRSAISLGSKHDLSPSTASNSSGSSSSSSSCSASSSDEEI